MDRGCHFRKGKTASCDTSSRIVAALFLAIRFSSRCGDINERRSHAPSTSRFSDCARKLKPIHATLNLLLPCMAWAIGLTASTFALPSCMLMRKLGGFMAIISRSVVTVARSATVMEAVELMAAARIGSVLVSDGDLLQGIFSERDVMLRV